MDHDTAKLDQTVKEAFENDIYHEIQPIGRKITNNGPKMANPAFHHWAVLVKCNNRDGVKKEAVFEGLKEDGKVIKNSLSSQLDCRNGWKFRQAKKYEDHKEEDLLLIH